MSDHRMKLDKHVGVPMRDGALLSANVFRPDAAGRFPVLMTLGPYGKDVHLSQFMPEVWERLRQRQPQIFERTSGKYLVWETPDPEMWVPHGYVVVRIDSRGVGASPGRLDVNSPAEFRDFYDAIAWAGEQPWSNGRVGLLGISYFAAGQWSVAAMRPPHLRAMLPWQGTYDFYRDRTRQGGIFGSGFVRRWWSRSVLRNQHGNAETPFTDIDTGERTTGSSTFSSAELEANRADYVGDILAHPLLDDWYRERIPDLGRIQIPALVVANWGGLGLHLRGTIEGYLGIASREKWLKVQTGSYFVTFLTAQSVALQRRFFDRYLKEENNNWEAEPKVEVEIRSPDDKIARRVTGSRWPLESVQWQPWHLDAGAKSLAVSPPSVDAEVGYQAIGDGITFCSPPLQRTIELVGAVKARLWMSSSTADMDVFVTLRAFDPQGKEVTFLSAVEPKSPLSQGWLRASHRKLDAQRSTEWRPFHCHDQAEPLTPDQAYPLDVEIWPMSVSLPAGYRLALTVQGKDFERADEPGPTKGSGWFLHDDPLDRPPEIFAGRQTIYIGPTRNSFLLLPALATTGSERPA
jgi:predicted acyl esterase